MLLFTKVDWNKLVIPALVETKKVGYRASTPLYEGSPLTILAPFGVLPFGASPPKPEENITKWTLPIAEMTDGGAVKPIMAQFFDHARALERVLINHAFKNADEFFGKPTKLDMCEEHFNKIVKYSKDQKSAEKYGPTISPTLGFNEDTKTFDRVECFGPDGKPFPIDKIPRRAKAIVQYRLAQVYSVNKKSFGLSMYVARIDIMAFSQESAKPPPLDAYEDPELKAALEARAANAAAPAVDPYDEDAALIAATNAAEATAANKRDREEPAAAAAAAPEPEQKKTKGKGKK
jgi:hypothetical protein